MDLDLAMELLQNICRLCHKNPGVENIFDSDLAIDIQKYLYLKIKRNIKLPETICRNCKEVVMNVKILSELAHTNESQIQALLKDDDSCQVDFKDVQISVRKDLYESKDSSPTSAGRSSQLDISQISQAASSETDIDTSLTLSERDNTQKSPKISRKKIKEDDSFTCDKCKKVFETQKKLRVHLRQHSRPFGCPLDACGKSFPTKGDLLKHIRHHTGEKPFQCVFCDRSFSQAISLRLHKEKLHSATMTVIENEN